MLRSRLRFGSNQCEWISSSQYEVEKPVQKECGMMDLTTECLLLCV